MTKTIKLKLDDMAHGGSAVGRDKRGKPVFVSYAIPGETVRAELFDERGNFSRANLVDVLTSSRDRVLPRCKHFGTCGGCHLQHMTYEAQLRAKRSVVVDQLQRIGGFKQVNVRPVLPNPQPYNYAIEVSFSPVEGGGLGFWAPAERRVIPIDECHLLEPRLLELFYDIDMDLEGLRKLTLRLGSNNEVLAALEVNDIEPPEMAADFPISVAIVLPDRTAASLIGDPYLVQTVKGSHFRFSPGSFFQPSIGGAELVVDMLLKYAALDGSQTVLEGYSGVGMLTSFLAAEAQQVVGIEVNPDSVEDATANLNHTENVSLYNGLMEEVLPALKLDADVLVVNPPDNGLTRPVAKHIAKRGPDRLVYVSSDIATLARDGKNLGRAGYRLHEIQPIDMRPQTFHIDSVSLWQR